MTIRECMLFIQNKKESITDEKELDFLDSAFTYLVDYYDHSKESKKEVITQSEIDALIEGLDNDIFNGILKEYNHNDDGLSEEAIIDILNNEKISEETQKEIDELLLKKEKETYNRWDIIKKAMKDKEKTNCQ